MKVTEFDKSKEFETKAEPLLQELLKVCKFYEIPLFITVCPKSEPEKTWYYNDHVSTVINHQKLFDDQIKKHILVADGFDVIQPGTYVEMNCEDLADEESISQEK
ncbi:hypothetical protein FYJ57_12060 [Lachnospiraceae bacterium BSM-380-WT-5A]|uniref:Uncharacterized protein n=1 Tax=Oliverpabstia intestinalis TaxID=2606633 RepID=A0A7X2TLJ5_9FIRM|nr:hypothetical protein [Oliverpabstia intestinalis]MST67431.1 hypothetical protein [Oliverpabstia intestinalis]